MLQGEAKLINDGPYKYICHPMYTGILIACFDILIADITIEKLLIFLYLF